MQLHSQLNGGARPRTRGRFDSQNSSGPAIFRATALWTIKRAEARAPSPYCTSLNKQSQCFLPRWRVANVSRTFGAQRMDVFQLHSPDFAIKKKQRIERLVLGARSNTLFSQSRQELFHFLFARQGRRNFFDLRTEPLQPTSLLIQRTPHPQPWFAQNVRINLRRRHILVPEQLLQRADVISILQQMRRKRMPQRKCRQTLNAQRPTLNVQRRRLRCLAV